MIGNTSQWQYEQAVSQQAGTADGISYDTYCGILWQLTEASGINRADTMAEKDNDDFLQAKEEASQGSEAFNLTQELSKVMSLLTFCLLVRNCYF